MGLLTGIDAQCLLYNSGGGAGVVRRSYKFRLRPTARQHVALQACLDDHRALYNAALEERRMAWRRCRVAVGIDLGITAFIATSDGELVANPRLGRKAASRLALAQQMLARKKPGSNNRRRQREVVANRHRKVASQRRDFHHRLARHLVDHYDVLVMEKLLVKNMTRSSSCASDMSARNVARKRGLNRSIFDAGWAAFARILADKAEEAGRQVVTVNPQYTSQTHWKCGLRGDREGTVFWCPHCRIAEHADLNAARNILRAGLAPQAADAA